MNTYPQTRRDMLRTMGLGFGSLGLAALLAGDSPAATTSENPLAPKAPHFPAKAKRIIHLFMNGGPSQVDTFDPKPALEKFAGQVPPESLFPRGRSKGKLMPSPFKFAKQGQSGIEVSEIYPHLSKCVDDMCIIRSMHTNLPNHEPSFLMMNSGETQPTRPCMGSWLTYGLGSENQNLPGYMVLCPGTPTVGPQLWSNSFLPGIYQGTHINNSSIDPKTIIRDINNRYVSQPVQRRQMDLLQQLNRKHLEVRGEDAQLEGRIASLEMAYRMQFEAQEAFDLAKESEATRELYGKGQFANGCLLARRLVERGVRMVQVYFGGGQPWDDHGDIMNHREHARQSDQAIAALLTDLKSRGMLQDTLIVWGGEFGRTPSSEGSKGRDHNNLGFSMWLAGGGIKGGQTYGATDELGFAAVDQRLHVHDLHATILHLMGLNHEKLTYRYSGRDFRLTDVQGHVAEGLLA